MAGATVGVGRLYKSRAPAPIARPLMPTANLEQARQGMTAALNREAWSEHHPTTLTENEFIEVHGFAAYGRWFLTTNSAYQEGTRRRCPMAISDGCTAPRESRSQSKQY